MGVSTIQFACTPEGEVVEAAQAVKGQVYLCPACRSPLIFRAGPQRVPHFAHKGEHDCSGESVLHHVAKLLIQRAVEQWKRGATPAPILTRACRSCGTAHEQRVPDTVARALLERRLADGSLADVVLVDQADVPLAAVEVRVEHAGDERKAARLPIPFIEVAGEAVLRDPARWVPLRDHLRRIVCASCREAYQRFQQKAAEVASRTWVPLPTTFYRYTVGECWKCHEEILLFAWPGQEAEEQQTPPAVGRPRTVQLRYSKTVRDRYWANTCPCCGVLEGNFFLFSEPDSPLFAFDAGEDTPEAFADDLYRLAARAARW